MSEKIPKLNKTDVDKKASVKHARQLEAKEQNEIRNKWNKQVDIRDPELIKQASEEYQQVLDERLRTAINKKDFIKAQEIQARKKSHVSSLEKAGEDFLNTPEQKNIKSDEEFKQFREEEKKDLEDKIQDFIEQGDFQSAEKWHKYMKKEYQEEYLQDMMGKVMPELKDIESVPDKDRVEYISDIIYQKVEETGISEKPPTDEEQEKYHEIAQSLAKLTDTEERRKNKKHLLEIKKLMDKLTPETQDEFNRYIKAELSKIGITEKMEGYDKYFYAYFEDMISEEIKNKNIKEKTLTPEEIIEKAENFAEELEEKTDRKFSKKERDVVINNKIKAEVRKQQNLAKNEDKRIRDSKFRKRMQDVIYNGKRAAAWSTKTFGKVVKWTGISAGVFAGVVIGGTIGAVAKTWWGAVKYAFKEGIDAFKNPFKGFKI